MPGKGKSPRIFANGADCLACRYQTKRDRIAWLNTTERPTPLFVDSPKCVKDQAGAYLIVRNRSINATGWVWGARSWSGLVLQSQLSALLLVVGAPSGGLMASSPDRPGERERRVDRWAPDQVGEQPAQLGDGERDQHAQGGHHDRPPSPSATSGRRARVAARNARAAMARVMCRYQAGYWRTW